MEAEDNKKKVIATVVIVVVIAILGVGASALKSSKKKDDSTVSTTSQVTQATTTGTSTTSASGSSTYKDGTYSGSSTYQSPGGTENIAVTITVKNGIVTASDISQEANNNDSEEYQADFKSGYIDSVVGKKLSDIKLSHVSGSSLTSEGFNSALEGIKTQATS